MQIHKSSIVQYSRCPKAFYFRDVIKMEPSEVWESSLIGVALHKTILFIHNEVDSGKEKWMNVRRWSEFFRTQLVSLKEEAIEKEQTIRELANGGLSGEDFMVILMKYLSKPYNQNAKVVLGEAEFIMTLKEERKPIDLEYQFAGTVDQLIEIEKKYCTELFPSELLDEADDTLFLVRDFKTGNRTHLSNFALKYHPDVQVYTMAMAYGEFSGKKLAFLPFASGLYYLQDHLPYKIGPKKGQEKGVGYHYIIPTELDLQLFRKELIKYNRLINLGSYPRRVDNHCNNCGYRQICEELTNRGE